MNYTERESLHTMHLSQHLKTQFDRTGSVIFSVTVLLLLVFGLFYIVAQGSKIPADTLTRDPSVLTNTPFYYGFFSYISIACWGAAAAVCFMGAMLINGRHSSQGAKAVLIYGGMLSLLLLVDDAFMLHETVFPQLLGIKEYLIYAVYLLMFAGFFILFWQQILKSDYFLLIAAFVAFGASIGLDAVFEISEWVSYTEDGLKLLGILFWLFYFASFTKKAVSEFFA